MNLKVESLLSFSDSLFEDQFLKMNNGELQNKLRSAVTT